VGELPINALVERLERPRRTDAKRVRPRSEPLRLEFRLRRNGLPVRAVDGRFTARTSAAVKRFQRRQGLVADGIAGRNTFRALSRRTPVRFHVVSLGESFFSIAERYHVSPWLLARRNGVPLTRVIVPGQRLALPAGARALPPAARPASRDAVRSAIDYWARSYGVDPALARALAWMESGFQPGLVSSAGARGVLQVLPSTRGYVEKQLIGHKVPRSTSGNIRIGVVYLRQLLREFHYNRTIALAAWYQGPYSVRKHGRLAGTRLFVRNVLALLTRRI